MNRSSYKEIVRSFEGKRIAVIGDLIVDKFVYGKVNRICPEAPVPVVKVQKEELMLGGSANVINNIKSLGGKVSIFGVVGDDEPGKWAIDKLKEMDTNIEGLILDNTRKTSIKTRVIAIRQQVVRIDDEQTHSISDDIFESISSKIKNQLNSFDAIVVSDYSKGVVSEELISFLTKMTPDVPILVDPKVNNFKFYKDVFVITPNASEACTYAQVPHEEEKESVLKAGKHIFDNLNCKHLLVTRSEHGMALFENEKSVIDIPTEAQEVADVSGAGDTVISVLALGLACKASLADSACISNIASGIVVGKLGTASVSTEELLGAVTT